MMEKLFGSVWMNRNILLAASNMISSPELGVLCGGRRVGVQEHSRL